MYLDSGGEAVHAVLHEPAPTPAASAERAAIVLVGPFGFEEIASHRPRREWAEHLAARGHAVLRLDLPGTGDSDGRPSDPGRVPQWVRAVGSAAAWLGAERDSPRTAAVAVGLGGLLALAAAAEGWPLDELVLWGVPASGRRAVRELQAFASMEAAVLEKTGEAPPPALDGGAVQVAGFVVSAQTQADLGALSTDRLVAGVAGRRVLLLGRDATAPPAPLAEALRQAGAAVSEAEGPGWARMLDEPNLARRPDEVIDTVDAWLAASAPVVSQASAAPAQVTAHRELLLPGGVRERPWETAGAEGRLRGILSEPPGGVERDGVCIVALNAGAVWHVGPNRMWVELARRWAGRGVPCLRVDVAGIGESDGDSAPYRELSALYAPELTEQVIAVLRALESEGVGRRFVLVGLCSGAYWAFDAAVREPSVVAALMLNPRLLFWSTYVRLRVRRESRKVAKLRSGSMWRRILAGRVHPKKMRRVIRAALARPFWMMREALGRPGPADEFDAAFDELQRRECTVLLGFARREELLEDLDEEGRREPLQRRPNVRLELLDGYGHTLRPVDLQRQGHALLDELLAAEVARADDRSTRPAAAAVIAAGGDRPG